MRVTLVVQSGPEAGRFVAVPPGSEVTVGRKAPSRFVIADDPTLSRTHFALSRDGPRCVIRDLGSTAGTLVNGEPVAEAEVKHGDVIEAGSTHLVVRIEAGAEMPAPLATPQPTASGDRVSEDWPTMEMDSPPQAGETLHDRVLERLRSQADPLFAILDAARDPLVLARLLGCPEQYQSLYEGAQGHRLAEAAPYLISLPPGSRMLDVLVREGWGNSWGVYLTCRLPFPEVRKHLRRFLIVKTEEGKDLFFRFYDPRVLRIFLPTCSPEEKVQFLGPITSLILEGSGMEKMLRFDSDGRSLKRHVILREEADQPT